MSRIKLLCKPTSRVLPASTGHDDSGVGVEIRAGLGHVLCPEDIPMFLFSFSRLSLVAASVCCILDMKTDSNSNGLTSPSVVQVAQVKF